MKKIFSFSLLLILGLVASQILPGMLGEGYPAFRAGATTFLYVCLSFIMINVGREFEIDKKRWRSYAEDYFIAMATAAVPWLLIALYYVFVLLPPEFWGNGDAWKENLLLSRFAAPTSAGILFTMLAALRLKRSWMYRKIQVLAIFDDLDTILLMIPLQILMIGLRWQLFVVVVIVSLLSNLGKLFPMFFYRDRKLSERLALSIGMFTRGEVGAGVIFIALGYSLGGPALVISVLTLVLNLVLTGIFVVWVKKLALRTYAPEEFDAVSTIR